MNEFIFSIQVCLITSVCLLASAYSKSALFSCLSLLGVMANLLVLKQTKLFGLEVTCSDAFAVGSILCLNLLQEKHGKKESQQAIYVCLGAMLFFVLSTQIHLIYQPSASDVFHSVYLELFTPAPRLLTASLVSFFLSQQLDIRLFALIKKKLPHWRFRSRSALSLMGSQALDTALFTILGLWGYANSLGEIFIFSYLIKLIVILISWILVR